jgi:hypothetical protein
MCEVRAVMSRRARVDVIYLNCDAGQPTAYGFPWCQLVAEGAAGNGHPPPPQAP